MKIYKFEEFRISNNFIDHEVVNDGRVEYERVKDKRIKYKKVKNRRVEDQIIKDDNGLDKYDSGKRED